MLAKYIEFDMFLNCRNSCSPLQLFTAPVAKYVGEDYQKIKVLILQACSKLHSPMHSNSIDKIHGVLLAIIIIIIIIIVFI